MERIKNIEFLRVIGCIAIILVHLFHTVLPKSLINIDIYNKLFNMTSNGAKAVDLFFILSGFFFAYKLNTHKTCWEFVKHKLIRLYPVLVFIMIIYFLFSLTSSIVFTYYDNILTLLCLNGLGLTYKHINAGHFWYVSAMLWVLLFYYYLLKNYSKKNVNLFISLIILFSYTFILHANQGGIGGTWQTYYNILNLGLLRALGGIGIGYFIGEWYKTNIEKINNWNSSTIQTILLSGLEFMTLYFIINNLILHKLKWFNQFIFIIAFTTIIMLFLVKKGIFSQILDNNICPNLAKYSYSLYMIHYPIFWYLRKTIWELHPELIYAHPILNIILTLLLVITAGVLTYHFVEKPAVNYLTNKYYSSRGGGGKTLATREF